ncbi:hypothetical protein LAZ67_3001864 [Cordylochernes scorpioides]|uniref:Transposase n=1 Tax=Cordylochernes scorpioides TaxID=51811 RepID=A0ABY6KAI9_9ARAC|nr:hypothetical protein LAZ67_3001864 [Cordylochernes scorpioides]
MEAPLKNCTTLEQRAVIRFLNAEGIQTSQICQKMKNIYVQKWTNYMFLRSQRSAGKVLLTIFWDIDGPICLDFLSSRQRMNSDLYCDILVNKLKPGIRNKRRGKLIKGVLFLHDNARPHTSCKTVSTIIKLDLAPSDYFLFGLLKKELKGKLFDSDEDVQKVVQDFFHTLPKSAYKEGIYKLSERWRRCLESQGTQTTRERERERPATAERPFVSHTIPNCLKSPEVLTDEPQLSPLGMSLLSQSQRSIAAGRQAKKTIALNDTLRMTHEPLSSLLHAGDAVRFLKSRKFIKAK